MASQKKFGTFSGVLTPSLLTILGVIMYMRLGSVVGNSSSIFQFIIIILFAHLISVTTGLSVSSIATDKKINKGGIYYMLTRSLGLPIGGAIGLTIFIATAFSISLYLIGFSESLIPFINEQWSVGGISTNKLRLFGSLALLVVLIIAYISTSFALKIQYVILGLIVLSMSSIFMGSSDGLKIGSDIIESPNFATLFGIFFPAVTGFTAGVAMSGDLKNPKISIPWGTMLSISIGLIVYIILALFIYYNIDREFLVSNNNVLIDFGAIPLLVLGGVWGATLSSALGGILGGPRILQAMSLDNITPKIFSSESGKNKEPRNALFLTFLIAEIGILIGELNVIAELVAMFYMAAYLFINLSCFLEQWSSPDFRPKFKIPIWISLLGAISTLLLMIQLNLAATLIAVLLMTVFWFWLSKKDLVLGTGDVWLSVWNTVVKTGLKNLQKKAIHKRNWQPNILLFSGGTKNRPHLIDFGKSIIGRAGMVSNFDLIETKSAKVLFPKSSQNVKDSFLLEDSIFHRKLYCQNIFKGVESIATTYGFSGIDPNTVLMGWGRNTKNPIWFGQMTQKLKDLDYNILYLDYDKNRGFGDCTSIDLWWADFNKENELSLQLVKFLRSSKKWKRAILNIYFVNSKDINSDEIEFRISSIIDRKRINAKYHVINNFLDQKDINDYIRIKSHLTDLILIKLPNLKSGSEMNFINSSNELFSQIGSALFLEASKSFEDLTKSIPQLKKINTKSNIIYKEKISGSLLPTFDNYFDNQTTSWQENLKKINKSFVNELQSSILKFQEYYINVLNKNKLIDELKMNLYDLEKVKDIANDLEASIVKNIEDYFYLINNTFSKSTKKLDFNYSINFLENSTFNPSNHNKKLLSNLLKNDKTVGRTKISVPIIKLIKHHLKNRFIIDFNEILKIFGNIHLKYINIYKEFIKQGDTQKILPFLDKINSEIFLSINQELNHLSTKLINAIIIDLGENDVNILSDNREEDFNPKSYRKRWSIVEEFPFDFSKNIFIFHNIKALYCSSLIVENMAYRQLDELSNMFNQNNFIQLDEILKLSKVKSGLNKASVINNTIDQIQRISSSIIRSLDTTNWLNNNEDIFDKIPSEINIYSPEIMINFSTKQDNLLETTYNLKSTLKYLYNENIISPINKTLSDYKDWINKDLEDIISSFKLIVFTMENQDDVRLIKDSVQKFNGKMIEFEKNLSLNKERFNSFINDLKINANKFPDYQYLMSNESKKYIDSATPLSSSSPSFYKIQNYISEKFLLLIDLLTIDNSLNESKSKSDKTIAIRDFINKCTPNEIDLNNIPKLYLQLFSKDANPNTFFSGFITKQISSFKKAISKKLNSNQNLVVISGESKSGKTYIIKNIIKSLDNKNCYAIDPPSHFFKEPLVDEVSKLLHLVNDTSFDPLYLDKLPDNSVIFLNDFDLWWRKSSNGYDLIKSWLEIFKVHNNKLFFVIEVNNLFLKSLMINTSIEDCVLKFISSSFFSNKQLENIVKHKNSLVGIDVYNNGAKINFAKSIRSSLNFNKIHDLVEGNIGWFNNFWISSLTHKENNSLEFYNDFKISFPPIFNDLELIILLQIFLHKKINLKHLEEYFLIWEDSEIAEHISFFKTEKILFIDGNYAEISPYILPYLNKFLKQNNLILN